MPSDGRSGEINLPREQFGLKLLFLIRFRQAQVG